MKEDYYKIREIYVNVCVCVRNVRRSPLSQRSYMVRSYARKNTVPSSVCARLLAMDDRCRHHADPRISYNSARAHIFLEIIRPSEEIEPFHGIYLTRQLFASSQPDRCTYGVSRALDFFYLFFWLPFFRSCSRNRSTSVRLRANTKRSSPV